MALASRRNRVVNADFMAQIKDKIKRTLPCYLVSRSSGKRISRSKENRSNSSVFWMLKTVEKSVDMWIKDKSKDWRLEAGEPLNPYL